MKRGMIFKIGAVTLSLAIILVGSFGAIGTGAWFSDVEASTGNVLTAGTLDLTVDGSNNNAVKFTVNPFVPGNQPTATYLLKNEGDITGYLDLHSIKVIDFENGIIEPESSAGDITPDVGELSGIVGITIYNDVDKDGYFSTGDVKIYDGMINGLASDYDTNIAIAAGETVKLNVVINWWTTENDNLAQSDSTTIDMGFELGQTAAQ